MTGDALREQEQRAARELVAVVQETGERDFFVASTPGESDRAIFPCAEPRRVIHVSNADLDALARVGLIRLEVNARGTRRGSVLPAAEDAVGSEFGGHGSATGSVGAVVRGVWGALRGGRRGGMPEPAAGDPPDAPEVAPGESDVTAAPAVAAAGVRAADDEPAAVRLSDAHDVGGAETAEPPPVTTFATFAPRGLTAMSAATEATTSDPAAIPTVAPAARTPSAPVRDERAGGHAARSTRTRDGVTSDAAFHDLCGKCYGSTWDAMPEGLRAYLTNIRRRVIAVRSSSDFTSTQVIAMAIETWRSMSLLPPATEKPMFSRALAAAAAAPPPADPTPGAPHAVPPSTGAAPRPHRAVPPNGRPPQGKQAR